MAFITISGCFERSLAAADCRQNVTISLHCQAARCAGAATPLALSLICNCCTVVSRRAVYQNEEDGRDFVDYSDRGCRSRSLDASSVPPAVWLFEPTGMASKRSPT